VNKIQFVSGKGGVGKTRTSLLLSQQNPDAVLAEITDSLEEEAKELQLKPPRIYNFKRAQLAEELLARTIKIKTLSHLLAKSKLFHTLLNLAPNLHELLLIRKWFELAEDQALIVDAPSTGHFLAFFDAIKTAQKMFDGGTLRKIANELDDYFQDLTSIEIILVSLPEHSALEEMDEIEKRIKEIYPQLKIKKILNRVHHEPQTELKLSDELKLLAHERPKNERERTAGKNFDHQITEGAFSL
jgi:anion-transporting  ArsA/GET3 family ATPase